jgi:hypothetical protein
MSARRVIYAGGQMTFEEEEGLVLTLNEGQAHEYRVTNPPRST